MSANPLRGEASLELLGQTYLIRPSFTALIAAENEIGSLFALAERAVEGGLSLEACEALLWHCLSPEQIERDMFRQSLLDAGLAALMPAVRMILMQILAGR